MAIRAGNQRYRAYTTVFWALFAVVIATLLDSNTLFHRRFRGPLAELEPSLLRREIEEALGKQIVALLDPEAVNDFLKHLEDRKRF